VAAGTFIVVLLLKATSHPTQNGDASEPKQPPFPMPPSDLSTHVEFDVPSDRAAKRSRVWSIIDELSDALRDDQEGAEALFVVRERFHRLQFSPPTESTDEVDDDTKPATKRPV
jgi:hypothetical protein